MKFEFNWQLIVALSALVIGLFFDNLSRRPVKIVSMDPTKPVEVSLKGIRNKMIYRGLTVLSYLIALIFGIYYLVDALRQKEKASGYYRARMCGMY